MTYTHPDEERVRVYYAYEEVAPGLYEESDRGARVYLARPDILPNFLSGGRRSCYIRLDARKRYNALIPHLLGWSYERAGDEC